MNKIIGILTFIIASNCLALNAQVDNDQVILNTLVAEYKVCLSTEAIYINNYKESFPSIVTALFNTEEELLGDSIKNILATLSDKEIMELKEKVLLLDKTYWFPINSDSYQNCNSDRKAALSKPIYFEDANRALVLTYRMVRSSSQDLVFLEKNPETAQWAIKQTLLVGFYQTYDRP